jgi:pimeloyl-ACP methyl ester carboxylesterase
MRWRNLLLGGSAAVGAAATYNAMARRDVAPLADPLGGDEGSFEWRGHRVAYTVRGSGPPVLLVHSIHAAGWSYEWKDNVETLAASHTVYAIDLLGFGRSDRPAIRYTARLYLSLISDFAEEVIGGPCALVASSLTAAYALVLGARDPARFSALVVVEPTGLVRLNNASGTIGDVARLGVDTPVLGTAFYHALVSRNSLTAFLKLIYHDNELVTEEMVDAYYATSHQPGAKHAPAAFLAQLLNIDVRHAVRRITQPALLVWGEQAVMEPIDEIRPFLTIHPDFETAIFDPSGDLPHSERAPEFNEIVTQFLSRVEARV